MSKTVYVEVTSNYSRSTWDDLGSTNYNPGDRVDYFDGSRNRIFVCINSNNSTTEPQNNPTDWAPAGSEEYPFLLIDSTNNLRVTTNSEWTLHGIPSSTVNFLVEELGTWTPDNPVGGNATYQADGAGGTIILGDGRYTWDYLTYAMWWPNNCTIQAKNKQKAYIIISGQYWAGNNVTWKDVVFYNSGTTNVIPGSYGTGYKHNLDSCLSTQETPWGTLTAVKQEPSSSLWTRTSQDSWNGGYIRGCTFDYQYKGSSFLFNLSGGTGAVFENNTFYIRVKHAQYQLLYNTGDIILKNNIFYIKYLQDGHGTQNFTRLGSATKGDNVVYLENDSDVGGTINNNLSGAVTINPQFIDPDKSNFSLRPSSSLIGGIVSNSSRDELYVTPAERAGPVSFDTPAGNYSFYTFSSYTGNKFIATMRTSYNGEIYECLVSHDYDSTQDPSSDSTNWRLVQGTIDDPYKSCDFDDSEGAINNKLTSNHDLILLDGDYGYFPITSDSSYPTTSPTLKSLNKHKAIIFHGSFRPAGFITKDLVFQNSLAVSGYTHYPLDGRVGFHLKNCVVHNSGTWWLPLNCVVTSCLIFQNFNNNQGMFYAAFGQASSPAPSDKAIIFTNNTVIFTGSLDSTNDGVLSSLINQGNSYATFKGNIFYVKSGFTGPCTKWTIGIFSDPRVVFEENVAFDQNGIIVDDLRGMEYINPKLVDVNSSDYSSFRLRPDSPCIGGVSNNNSSVWVSNTAGTGGSGTYIDPFNFGSLGDAIIAAGPNGDIVFKNGSYSNTSLGNFIFNDVSTTTNQVNFHAETPGKVEFVSNGQIKFGDNTFSPSTAATYNGLIFKTNSSGTDPVTINQAPTDPNIKHHFSGCGFEARIFLEHNGQATYPKVKFIGCTFSCTGSSYMFEQRNGSTSPPIIIFKNCLLHNYSASSAGSSTGLLRRLGDLTLDGTIAVDYFNTSTSISIAHTNLTVKNCNFVLGNGSKLGTDDENLGVDPKFVSPSKGNFSLRPNSPLVGIAS